MKVRRAELYELLSALDDGSLTHGDAARLAKCLQASASARRLYIEHMQLSASLGMHALDAQASHRKPALEAWINADGHDMAVDALAELARLHDEGLGQPITLDHRRSQSRYDSVDHAGRRLKLKTRLVIGGGLAAVIALGGLAVVVLSLFGGPDQQVADNAQADVPVVATVSRLHDAAWQDEQDEPIAFAVGDELVAGRTLALTEGFAEITTARGAVAILEAPATIELVNNDNAIHLHNGKLVGICETAESKGLLVRAPHMDITDLGTRFGVDATQADATRVHVLEGEVEVVGVSTSGEPAEEPKRLTMGEALASDPSADLMPVAFEQSSFTQDIEHLSYQPAVQGLAALWRGQASGDLSLHAREAAAVQVFIERKGVRLERDTAVDLAGDRAWSKGSVPGKHTVAAGSRVDVYLLHLDPMRKQNVRGDYTVRFDRPILGVIAHQDTLVTTDESLGAPGTTYPVITGRHATVLNVSIETQRGLDIAMSDSAAITDGGTVLHVKSNAASVSDQVRVLVRAMQE